MKNPKSTGDSVVAFFRLMGTRVLVAWIFNNTGNSVFAAILFHAVDNTALVAFPEINAVVPWGSVIHCGLVMTAAFVVTILWGPRSLARFRFDTERRQREQSSGLFRQATVKSCKSEVKSPELLTTV